MSTLEVVLEAAAATCDELNTAGWHREARAFAIFAQRLDFRLQKQKRAERAAVRRETDLYNEALGDGQR